MNKVVSIVLAACLVLSAGLASASTWAQIKEKGVITVGNAPDYPPFESIDDKGERVGFDIDLVRAVAKRMGLKVEFVTLGFEVIVTAVQSGQVDLGVSGMSINDERKQFVNFTDPYFTAGQVVVTTPESGIKTLADLKGKRVSAPVGTTSYAAAEKLEGIELTAPEDYNMSFALLKGGGCDAAVADIPVAEEYVKQGGFTIVGEPLTFEEFAMIANKDNADFIVELNKALAEVKASGEHEALMKKWGLK
ncbi:basic amino acid ABC transporter substrate-binding protein [Paucidesulfovibrio longus]|uniref:basic amino acid ABC transporter substrate-binding protein n=1 Tax=Paucidesulfovibrio longus TaxID=889 RepID=UPI0003B5BCEA|nr:basic amino acid ABC transporter substrate-binding protein [Paucidesulfovibrio longus]